MLPVGDYEDTDYEAEEDFFADFQDETLRVRTRASDRERKLKLRREIERRLERRRACEELGLDSLDF